MNRETWMEISADAQPKVNLDGRHVVYPLMSEAGADGLSLALIILNGLNEQVKNKTTESEYFIVTGKGHFTFWDGGYSRSVKVESGDRVTIPAGIPYQDEGVGLVMIAMNHPAFDPDDVVVLD